MGGHQEMGGASQASSPVGNRLISIPLKTLDTHKQTAVVVTVIKVVMFKSIHSLQ